MDLSFQFFAPDRSGIAISPLLAVLVAGMAARQAISPTATVAARLGGAAGSGTRPALLAPSHGAFNLPMARLIARWAKE